MPVAIGALRTELRKKVSWTGNQVESRDCPDDSYWKQPECKKTDGVLTRFVVT